MNENSIRKELSELRKNNFPSDQDLERIQELTEQLEIIRQEQDEPIAKKINLPKVKELTQEKKQESKPKVNLVFKIIDGIILLIRGKPATLEQIQQLKLEAVKWRLKADVEKSKASIRKHKQDKWKFLESGTSSRRSSYESNARQLDSKLRGGVGKPVKIWSNKNFRL